MEFIDLLEREFIIVNINKTEIIKAYAEMDAYAESRGKKLCKNDLWIAATAKAADAVLLTTDKDFDVLHSTQVKRIWIDQSLGKKP